MRHNPGYGIMQGFMASGGVITLDVMESREGRKLDAVSGWRIISAVAAVVHDCWNVGKKCLGGLDAFCLWRGFGHDMKPLGESLDLRHVKDGVGFQETERLRLVLAAGFVAHGLAAVAVINDICTAFALAHLCAQGLGLSVGHP